MNVHSHVRRPMNQPQRLQPQVEPRALEILEGVRRAFAEKGFDGASMLDLARACGMSVGNFYRYFPSKAAIVAALITRDLAEVEAQFGAIIQSDDPMATLRMALHQRIEQDQCAGDGQLWAEITAAAIRKPEIGAAALQMEETITALLASIFARVTRRPLDEARQRYQGQAQVLVMLVKAMAMRTAQSGPAQPALAAQVVLLVDRILTDISNDIAKG